MGRLVQTNRKATVAQSTTVYNSDMQKGISENMLNLEADGLQKRKTTLGSTFVN